MKKLDLILGGVLLAVAGIFYYMIAQLPEKSQIYPMFVTTVLLVLTLIHIFITIRKKSSEDESNVFEGFLPRQFSIVLGLSGLYILLINVLGYISSTFLYIGVTLISLKTDKKVALAISLGMSAGIYVLFKILLKVPLPQGLLF